MDKGDLRTLLQRKTIQLTTKICLDFMKQIASGLEFIHGIPVVHGDIATRNIQNDFHKLKNLTQQNVKNLLRSYS